MTRIRHVNADDWREWRDLRLRALRESPEAFSSTVGDWLFADEARWRARLTDVAYNVIADLGQVPAGMASGSQVSGDVELMSLWVAPSARAQRVGDALVDAVLDFAATSQCVRVTLEVRAANEHAIALYRRHGFVDAGPSLEVGAPGEPAEHKMVYLVPN
jgi:ribosomal protein S18 acetylase RimI-like enzyme